MEKSRVLLVSSVNAKRKVSAARRTMTGE